VPVVGEKVLADGDCVVNVGERKRRSEGRRVRLWYEKFVGVFCDE
jgi:hypothetical protein